MAVRKRPFFGLPSQSATHCREFFTSRASCLAGKTRAVQPASLNNVVGLRLATSPVSSGNGPHNRVEGDAERGCHLVVTGTYLAQGQPLFIR